MSDSLTKVGFIFGSNFGSFDSAAIACATSPYGLVNNVNTFNPVKITLMGWQSMIQDIKKAQSECQMYCLDFIMKDKSWQSKAWLLERRFPDRWAKKDMTINENNEKVINFTYG